MSYRTIFQHEIWINGESALPCICEGKKQKLFIKIPLLWSIILLWSVSIGHVHAKFDNLADVPRHVAISEKYPIVEPMTVFNIPESVSIKPYALCIQTAEAALPPESLSFNGEMLSQNPVRGGDNNWYYLIASAYLQSGENRLDTPAGAVAIEMVSLESTHEEERFISFFSPRAMQTSRSEQRTVNPNQLKFDVLDYDLTITLDMQSAIIPAATLTMTALSLDSSLTIVPLDFDSNNGQMVVSQVYSGDGNTTLPFTHEGKQLSITLNEPVPEGSSFTISIAYSGYPSNNYNVGLHGSTPIVWTCSPPFRAHTWWPCKDVLNDRATMSAQITCPTDYTAVSNGSLTDLIDNGDGTHSFHWRESYPMDTLCFTISCTNYTHDQAVYTALDGLTTMGVSHYTFPEANEPALAVNGTVKILEFYAKTFGEYPFLTEKYANVTFPRGGGNANNTLANLHQGSAGSNGLTTLNAHEAAHQYFACLVSLKDLDHLWLLEGFARYCEALFTEEQSGENQYHSFMNNLGSQVSDAYPLVSAQAGEKYEATVIYNKGAWVLHMLRKVVGDDLFFQALRNYVADPKLAYGVADSADVQRHFELVSGQSLSWFFDEWLYRASRPAYKWAYRPIQETDGSWSVGLWVEQTQNDEPYVMPIDLRVSLQGISNSVKSVFVDREEQILKIPVGLFEPLSVTWDPDNWVLDIASKVSFPTQALWIDSSSLDYGAVAVGQAKTLAVALENLGTETLHVTSLTLSGSGAEAYSIVSFETDAFALPGGPAFRREILIQYVPNSVESIHEAKLTIQTSDAGEAVVNLLGNGSYALDVVIDGLGMVDTDPSGSDFDADSTITLTATPGTGQQFLGWTGDVPAGEEQTNPLALNVTDDLTITAHFTSETLDFEGNWTWMGGLDADGTIPTYGLLGVPDPTNIPGGREDAVSWTDTSGKLWLFGGSGFDSLGNSGGLNDLWKYDPATNAWTWMKGSNTANTTGTYGVFGVVDSTNTPGTRWGSVSWIGDSGGLWLFGGYGFDSAGNKGFLNDLWKYDPATNAWTWMKGSNTANTTGTYGVFGVVDSTNTLGARLGSVSWIGDSGGLWLFGGYGFDSVGNKGLLNDLWKYDPVAGNWIWMHGSDAANTTGTYGVLGTSDPLNTPGARGEAVSWTDGSGNLWVFGGSGIDSAGTQGYLDDLWKYDLDSGNWTWVDGFDTRQHGGWTEHYQNNPWWRDEAVSWTDTSGDLWLFGGTTFLSKLMFVQLNDLWRYDPVSGRWSGECMWGSHYGTLGVPDPLNRPVCTSGAVSWVDDSGAFWLFGGYDDDLWLSNALWKYTPAAEATTHSLTITLEGSGVVTTNPSGLVFDTYTTVTLSATPDTGQEFAGWSGDIYAGEEQTNPLVLTMDADRTVTARFEPQVFWIGVTAEGYGAVKSDPAGPMVAFNTTVILTAKPKAGQQFLGWTGDVPVGQEQTNPLVLNLTGDLMLTAQFTSVTLDFEGNWTWMKGSNAGNMTGTYGTLGVADPANTPGARSGAVSWSDNSGALWLFGGYGEASDYFGPYVNFNDLWKYDPITSYWTWMKGSTPEVYGTLGVPDPLNVPSRRSNAASWTDNSGALWLFGGGQLDISGSFAHNDLWQYNPDTGNWTWMKGSDMVSQPGIYGTFGVSDFTNTPGARRNAVTWTDHSGALWLFGGCGHGSTGNSGVLNDLWKYVPATDIWTWMKGSDTCSTTGTYGTVGVPDTANTPGARSGSVSWTDVTGALWLFGGYGIDGTGESGELNDLWKYNSDTGNWTWMKGADTPRQEGTYGTLGVPDPANTPGAREGAISWVDDSGALWLYGGYHDNSAENYGQLSDLWKYNPATNSWTWMEGSDAENQPGNYDTLGVPSSASTPGGRSGTVSWINDSGALWLFGGAHFDQAQGGSSFQNDMWKYTLPVTTYTLSVAIVGSGTVTTTPMGWVFDEGATVTLTATPDTGQEFIGWTGDVPTGEEQTNPLTIIMDGDTTITAHFETLIYTLDIVIDGYGAVDTNPSGSDFDAYSTVTLTATPGTGQQFLGWSGNVPTGEEKTNPLALNITGDLILTAQFTSGTLDFEGNWTWMNGSADANTTGTYGTPGVPDPANNPGARSDAVSWTDNSGALWIFGGYGKYTDWASGYYGPCVNFDDLWKYDPITCNWTWMKGLTREAYGTLGVPDPLNAPSGRSNAASWTDNSGSLWLFGGGPLDGAGSFAHNDLWQYNPDTGNWTWMKGSDMVSQPGIYGTFGVSDFTNTPGARRNAVTWTDHSGALWLFGGYGHDSTGNSGVLNDLWKYVPATDIWIWMKGSDTCSTTGTYGTVGVSDMANTPGARSGSVSWTDVLGALWLFGGYGYDSAGTSGELNDLWKYNPSTGKWARMKGSDTCNTTGTYGTFGVPAPGNTPGGRSSAVSWIDDSGALWLFGGNGRDSAGNYGQLSDLWKYNPATNNWTWMKGSDAKDQPGNYDTLGVPSSANTPGGRSGAVSWINDSGALWLFGGEDYHAGIWCQNDMWKYTPAKATPTYNLTVTTDGDGTVTTNPPSSVFDADTDAKLTATPDAGHQFTGWSGPDAPDDVTSNPLTLLMDGDKTLTANFEPIPPALYTLTVVTNGSGEVDWQPEGTTVVEGTTVTLTATPSAGHSFIGWSGDAVGTTNPLILTMDCDTTITANFQAIPPVLYTLTVFSNGNGNVEKEPDTATYIAGSIVTLTAVPDAGHFFTGWSVDAVGTTNPLTLFMDADTNITANFEAIPPVLYSLTVLTSGDGSVEKEPNGGTYVDGTIVTLTATPDSGHSFIGWSGDAGGLSNSLVLTMSSNKNITANFAPDIPVATPTNLVATDGLYESKILVTWDASTSPTAMHYQVRISDGNNITMTPWQTDLVFEDTAVTQGVTYTYCVRAAEDAEGTKASDWCDADEGSVSLVADMVYYKVTYAKCAVTDDGAGSLIVSGEPKGTVKISRLKSLPKSMEPKEGKYFYLHVQTIPQIEIAGSLRKLFCDAPVVALEATGSLQSITTRENIEFVNAQQIGSLKMTVLKDDAVESVSTTIITEGAEAMKLSLLGVILENLQTTQSVKYIKAGSKVWKDKVSRTKKVSLGGIGRVGVASDAVVSTIEATGGIKTISASGASIAPDEIISGGIATLSISAKPKKLNGVSYGGFLGFASANPFVRVSAADMKTIYGYNGVAAICRRTVIMSPS